MGGRLMIKGARAIFGVRTPTEWAERQETLAATAHVIDTPVYARVEANRWLFICQCRSGVFVEPDWPIAYCLEPGCGLAYTNILLPDPAILDALDTLPEEARYYYPGEAVDVVTRTTEQEVWFRFLAFMQTEGA